MIEKKIQYTKMLNFDISAMKGKFQNKSKTPAKINKENSYILILCIILFNPCVFYVKSVCFPVDAAIFHNAMHIGHFISKNENEKSRFKVCLFVTC